MALLLAGRRCISCEALCKPECTLQWCWLQFSYNWMHRATKSLEISNLQTTTRVTSGCVTATLQFNSSMNAKRQLGEGRRRQRGMCRAASASSANPVNPRTTRWVHNIAESAAGQVVTRRLCTGFEHCR